MLTVAPAKRHHTSPSGHSGLLALVSLHQVWNKNSPSRIRSIRCSWRKRQERTSQKSRFTHRTRDSSQYGGTFFATDKNEEIYFLTEYRDPHQRHATGWSNKSRSHRSPFLTAEIVSVTARLEISCLLSQQLTNLATANQTQTIKPNPRWLTYSTKLLMPDCWSSWHSEHLHSRQMSEVPSPTQGSKEREHSMSRSKVATL